MAGADCYANGPDGAVCSGHGACVPVGSNSSSAEQRYACDCDDGWSSQDLAYVWGANDCALQTQPLRDVNLAIFIMTIVVTVPPLYHLFVTRLYRQRMALFAFPTRMFAAYSLANAMSVVLCAGMEFAPQRWVVGRHAGATVCFMAYNCLMGTLALDMAHHFAGFWLRVSAYTYTSADPIVAPTRASPRAPAPTAAAAAAGIATGPLFVGSKAAAATAAAVTLAVPAVAAGAEDTDTGRGRASARANAELAAKLESLPRYVQYAMPCIPLLHVFAAVIAYFGVPRVGEDVYTGAGVDGRQPAMVVLIDAPMESAATASLLCWAAGFGVAMAVCMFSLRRVRALLAAEAHSSPVLAADPAVRAVTRGLWLMDSMLRLVVAPLVPLIVVFALWPYLRHRAALLVVFSLITGAPASFLFIAVFGRTSSSAANTTRIAPTDSPAAAAAPVRDVDGTGRGPLRDPPSPLAMHVTPTPTAVGLIALSRSSAATATASALARSNAAFGRTPSLTVAAAEPKELVRTPCLFRTIS